MERGLPSEGTTRLTPGHSDNPDRSRRIFVLAATAVIPAAMWSHRTHGGTAHFSHYDAVITRNPEHLKLRRTFPCLDSALAAAPRTNATYRIRITDGSFVGRAHIMRPNVHLFGEGMGRSVLCFDAHAGALSKDGTPLGTTASATLTVSAPGFAARDLTIANQFDYLGERARRAADPLGANGLQAVAMALIEGAEGSRFRNVQWTGHQDTLLIDRGEHRFADCRISGSVDFIFGAGLARFDDCILTSRWRPLNGTDQGCVTAASTPRSRQAGFLFRRCRLEREAGVPDHSVWLGRPWRPTRAFADGRYGDPDASASAAFRDCWMDRHIRPERWTRMSYQDRSGARVWLYPDRARFSESGTVGPGQIVR